MAEPAQRRTNDDGGKFYEHPTRVDANGDPQRYDSVTSALTVYEKDGLKWWSAKIAARRAMENLPKLLAAQREEPCGRTWARSEPYRCDVCPECIQRWVELYHVGEANRRRREGSVLHDVLEYRITRGEWPDGDALVRLVALQNQAEGEQRIELDTMAPYIANLRRWWDDYGITTLACEAAEMTVWNHTHNYAGTLDAVITIYPETKLAARLCARLQPHDPYRPVTVIVDLKTREGEDKQLYAEHALQLAPYRHAETATLKVSGEEVRMPATSGGVVLQVRPDGYHFEPVLTRMTELQAFLNVLAAYRWKQRNGPASIAVATFPVPKGWAWDADKAAAMAVEPAAVPAEGAAPVAGATTDAAPAPAKKATRAPRKAAAKKATAPVEPAGRVASATLDSIATTGGRSPSRGNTLRDEDIPF